MVNNCASKIYDNIYAQIILKRIRCLRGFDNLSSKFHTNVNYIAWIIVQFGIKNNPDLDIKSLKNQDTFVRQVLYSLWYDKGVLYDDRYVKDCKDILKEVICVTDCEMGEYSGIAFVNLSLVNANFRLIYLMSFSVLNNVDIAERLLVILGDLVFYHLHNLNADTQILFKNLLVRDFTNYIEIIGKELELISAYNIRNAERIDNMLAGVHSLLGYLQCNDAQHLTF